MVYIHAAAIEGKRGKNLSVTLNNEFYKQAVAAFGKWWLALEYLSF
jgi:hypothetical protein